MENFQLLNLPAELNKSLARLNFTTPTPIQAAAIPPALKGKDILGSAQTGTGKTIAFGIPLVAYLLNSKRGTALVLTPTRELAMQVEDSLAKLLGPSSPIKTALLIGGDSMPKQLQQLQRRPRLIVATPGRLNDHLARGSLLLHDAGFLVMDETDRMLDMGFGVQIEKIVKYLPKQRQTLMFSATLPANIIKMSANYLNQPERVSVGSLTAPVAKIKQEVFHLSSDDKFGKLKQEISNRQGSIIVFVKTKWGTEKLAKRLRSDNHRADAIHGDLRQNQRQRVIDNFRRQQYRILVATDIAARGLDIPHIEHVINYDLPQCPEDYIHRIGRTGRAGAEGSAICFISPEDKDKWRAITKLINPGEVASNGAPHGGENKRSFGNKNRKHRKGGKGFFNRNSEGRSSGENFGSRENGEKRRSFGGEGFKKREGNEKRENRHSFGESCNNRDGDAKPSKFFSDKKQSESHNDAKGQGEKNYSRKKFRFRKNKGNNFTKAA